MRSVSAGEMSEEKESMVAEEEPRKRPRSVLILIVCMVVFLVFYAAGLGYVLYLACEY